MNFRGAVIEDLDLPPPPSIFESTKLADAKELIAFQTHIFPPFVPVLRRTAVNGRPTCHVIGYLTNKQLESEISENEDAIIEQHLHVYEAPHLLISSPLEHAINVLKSAPIAEVWDAEHKLVLATITAFDLNRRLNYLY